MKSDPAVYVESTTKIKTQRKEKQNTHNYTTYHAQTRSHRFRVSSQRVQNLVTRKMAKVYFFTNRFSRQLCMFCQNIVAIGQLEVQILTCDLTSCYDSPELFNCKTSDKILRHIDSQQNVFWFYEENLQGFDIYFQGRKWIIIDLIL